jgi:F0F1-type ATP synthase assembly protein I
MLSPEEERELENKLNNLKKNELSFEKKQKKSESKIITDPDASIYMRYTHLGIEFIAIFGVILWLGIQADRHLGSEPLGILLGAFLGFAAAMTRIIKAANDLEQQ